MKRSKTLLCIAFIALILLSVAIFAACEEKEYVTGISSVEIKDDTVTIKATLDEAYASDHSKDTVYILALDEMQPDGSLKGAEVVAEAKAKKSMSFKFSLVDGIGASRVACAFVLAEKNGEKYSALTNFAYITNPEAVAQKNEGPKSTTGIQGIVSNDPVGAAVIGAEHMIVEANMADLILEEFDPDAIRFNYENITYFYDKDEVESLDSLFSDAYMAGTRVYIRTVYVKVEKNKNPKQMLPDLSSGEGVRLTRAFYAFLASRYSAADYIIGDRVNKYGEYSYNDALEAEEFERMYSFWARIANNVLKSVNSSAKVYIPVDNSWKSDGQNGVIGAQAFLSHFASSAKACGDYNYAVAINLGDGDDLTALLKDEGYNYSKLGAINLSEFSDFIDKSEMRYKSEKRDMIIDGLDLSSVKDSKNSAAYYTLAYYTAAENGFDAFVYSGELYGRAYSRGALYFAYMMCGSSMNAQLADYTDRLVGAYVPSFEEHITNNLTYVQTAVTDIKSQIEKQKKDFPVALSDFAVVGDVSNYQGILDENGVSWLLEADLESSYGGIMTTNIPAKDIVSSGYIGVTLDSADNRTLCVLLKNEDAGAQTYSFVGECRTLGGKNTYYFDISDFTEGVEASDEITLAVCFVPDGDDGASAEIVDISLYGVSASDTETTIIIIVVVVILAALIGLIVLLVVKRKKKASAHNED